MVQETTEQKRRRSTQVTRVLLAITALGLFVFVTSIGLTAWFLYQGERADVTEGSYLFVKLSGKIPDAPMRGGLVLDPEDFPPIVTEVSEAIREASSDERISGVYLRLDGPMIGWGGTQEIRDALKTVTEAGKPCVVYSEAYETKTYYLASVCDHVVVAPSGLTMVSGLAITVAYYRETFEKLGVEPELEHVGDFKSATEPFQLTGPSEAAAEAYEALLDSLFTQVVTGIAESRGKTPDEVRGLVDNMRLTPEAALEQGLVDAVAFPDAVATHLATTGVEGWPEKLAEPYEEMDDDGYEEHFTPLSEYLKEIRSKSRHKKNVVAVVHAEGAITSGDGDGGLFEGESLADRPFRRWMRAVREDDAIKAVVLRVNSPGGSGLASDLMWHEIELTKAAGKPVVVSMADYAASGGYYISCNADWIVSQPATLTGSIGVLGGKFNLAGTYEKIGLHEHTFKRGELADLLSSSQSFTDEGRAVFRGYLESFYHDFVQKVADGRRMEWDAVHAVAQGRVWTGEQALDRGLVDELGGIDKALAKAVELAQIGEDYGIRRWPEQKSFIDLLVEDLQKAEAPKITVEIDPELPGGADALGEILLVQQMLSDNGVLTYLPGHPTVK